MRRILLLFVLGGSCSLGPGAWAADEVTVYLTAKGTSQRLAPAGVLTFEPKAQPLETEKTVFVDPVIGSLAPVAVMSVSTAGTYAGHVVSPGSSRYWTRSE